MAAELFDKIYGRYYYVVRRMLEAGARASLTRRDMDDVCGAYSYRESALTIVPKLTGGGWALFEQREDKTYVPVLHHPDRLKPPLTGLQKSWLKSLLADPRARLFFTDSQLAEVEEALGDTESQMCIRDSTLAGSSPFKHSYIGSYPPVSHNPSSPAARPAADGIPSESHRCPPIPWANGRDGSSSPYTRYPHREAVC